MFQERIRIHNLLFRALLLIGLLCTFFLVGSILNPSQLFYWRAIVPGVAAVVVGIWTAYRFDREGIDRIEMSGHESRTLFLVLQFLISVASFGVIVALFVSGWSTSEYSTILWSACVSLVLVSALQCRTRNRLWLILVQSALVVVLFVLPGAFHYVNYHGRSDLFFHDMVADGIVQSGHIPDTDYRYWPVWHTGVALTSLMSGIDVRLSVFLFVGQGIMLAVLFVALFSVRLSKDRRLGALASVLILASPAFLLWTVYLTPTALSFGIFSVIMWLLTLHKSYTIAFLFLLLSGTIVLTHHLSSLIVVVLLLVGYLFLRFGSSRVAYHRELALDVQYPLILAATTILYWISFNVPMFEESLAKTTIALGQTSPLSPGYVEEGIVGYLLIGAWRPVLILVVSSFFILRLLRWRLPVLRMGPRTSNAVSILSLFAPMTAVGFIVPFAIFAFIQFTRWALFGSFFAAIVGAIFVFQALRTIQRRRFAVIFLSALLFVAFLSASSNSSFDSLPFRENKFGFAPTPYLLLSEVELGTFVLDHFNGSLSCDVIFSGYLEYGSARAHNLSTDSTIGGYNREPGNWIVRVEEAKNRGLEYQSGYSPYYLSFQEVESSVKLINRNCICDVGSSEMMTSAA